MTNFNVTEFVKNAERAFDKRSYEEIAAQIGCDPSLISTVYKIDAEESAMRFACCRNVLDPTPRLILADYFQESMGRDSLAQKIRTAVEGSVLKDELGKKIQPSQSPEFKVITENIGTSAEAWDDWKKLIGYNEPGKPKKQKPRSEIWKILTDDLCLCLNGGMIGAVSNWQVCDFAKAQPVSSQQSGLTTATGLYLLLLKTGFFRLHPIFEVCFARNMVNRSPERTDPIEIWQSGEISGFDTAASAWNLTPWPTKSLLMRELFAFMFRTPYFARYARTCLEWRRPRAARARQYFLFDSKAQLVKVLDTALLLFARERSGLPV